MKTKAAEIKFHRCQNKTRQNKINFFVSFLFILAFFLNVTSTPQAFAKPVSKNQAVKSDVKEKDKTQNIKDTKNTDLKKKSVKSKKPEKTKNASAVANPQNQSKVNPASNDSNGGSSGGGQRDGRCPNHYVEVPDGGSCDDHSNCTINCLWNDPNSSPPPGRTCFNPADYSLNGLSCTDECVPNGVCNNGSCFGEQINCDDGNSCTTDFCDRHQCDGMQRTVCNPCHYASISAGWPCDDDNNQCTGSGHCSGGHDDSHCVQDVPPVVCPPVTEQCTENRCDPATGTCHITGVSGMSCNDGQPDPECSSDACWNGFCLNFDGDAGDCGGPQGCPVPGGSPSTCTPPPGENCVLGGVYACNEANGIPTCHPIYDQECMYTVFVDPQIPETCLGQDGNYYSVVWRNCSDSTSRIHAFRTIQGAAYFLSIHPDQNFPTDITIFIREGIYHDETVTSLPSIMSFFQPHNVTIQPYNYEQVLLRPHPTNNGDAVFELGNGGFSNSNSSLTFKELNFQANDGNNTGFGHAAINVGDITHGSGHFANLNFINLQFVNLNSSAETLAIDLDRGVNATMKNVQVIGAGINVSRSDNVQIQNVRVYDYSAGDGIKIDSGSQHVTITDSTATQNSGTGFNIGSRTNFLKGNTAWSNRQDGFRFTNGNSYANRLLSVQNGGYGIQMTVGSDNLVPTDLALRNSTVADNAMTQIQMTGVPNSHLIPDLAQLSLQNTIAMTAFDQPTALALNIPADISADQRYLFIDRGSNILRNREGDNSQIPAINLHGIDYDNGQINRNEVPGLSPKTNALDPMMFRFPGDGPLYRLSSGSPAIDTGTFAMFTNQARDNTRTISVDGEPRYFFLPGDTLQVQNSGYGVIQTMSPNTIRILPSNQPLSYSEGMGVNDPYTGSAPDIGRFESNPTPNCVGDLNGDGRVGVEDLSLLLATFGINNGGDVDHDGDTDIRDMSILFSHFGESC